jgi:hypothetical protein
VEYNAVYGIWGVGKEPLAKSVDTTFDVLARLNLGTVAHPPEIGLRSPTRRRPANAAVSPVWAAFLDHGNITDTRDRQPVDRILSRGRNLNVADQASLRHCPEQTLEEVPPYSTTRTHASADGLDRSRERAPVLLGRKSVAAEVCVVGPEVPNQLYDIVDHDLWRYTCVPARRSFFSSQRSLPASL